MTVCSLRYHNMSTRLALIFFMVVFAARGEDAESLFVRRVWPLFQEKCLACHGNDEKKIKADYDMRTLASTIKGGESEVKALVPGKPEESPLYLASTRTHDDWEPMPPKEADQLKPEQLEWIKEWISGGAPWPDETKRNKIARAQAKKTPRGPGGNREGGGRHHREGDRCLES